jgi:hypothetical protein
MHRLIAKGCSVRYANAYFPFVFFVVYILYKKGTEMALMAINNQHWDWTIVFMGEQVYAIKMLQHLH